MLKNLILFGILITSAFMAPTWAMDTSPEEQKVNCAPYKIREYDDTGPIHITFKHTPKGETEPKPYHLVSLSCYDINDLVPIYRSPAVTKTRANFGCPTIEQAKDYFEYKLVSRVREKNSFFPFIIKEETKVPGVYKVIGFFGINNGLAPDERDRTFDLYLEENSQGKGIGGAITKVGTHFIMQFHEEAPHTLIITPQTGKTRQVNIQKTFFKGAVGATCLPDNYGAHAPLVKVGFRDVPALELEKRGFTWQLQAYTFDTATNERKKVQEKYFELTWDQFKENEAKGMYKQ